MEAPITTIPASRIVQVLPSVLSAGGNALVLNGLLLTQNTRVPYGTVESFADSEAISGYFGPLATETTLGGVYFGGFVNATQLPGSMLVAQYPQSAIAAFLRGGDAGSYTLAQLQSLSGNISVTVDGYTRTASNVNLASYYSFTAAAGAIQSALNASPSVLASFTGSIGSQSASFTGSIAGNVLTVTALTNGTLQPGAVLTGTGIMAGTAIQNQLTVSGSAGGGIGTYAVNNSQVVASEGMTAGYSVLTVTSMTSGSLAVGQTVQGTGVGASSQISGLGTATGTVGTYFLAGGTQSVLSEGMTTIPTAVGVSYDSVSGGFIITSGVSGAASSIGFASGTLAASLFLTQAGGAVLGEGSPGLTPSQFMNTLITETQNWASFMLATDPDAGAGNTQKMAFATWTAEQDDRYVFVCWDTDITPTESTNAAASMGQLIAAADISGVCLVWDTTGNTAAFVCGAIASVDFSATGGRISFAGRQSAAGITADVTTDTVAENLLANNYNFYGAYGTANQNFIWFWNGSISGPFTWLDSYINQIWMNSQFQLALMELIANVNSIPYNAAGAALIAAALTGTIQQAVTFGAIVAGVTLSATQTLQVNNVAGGNIATVLQNRGWYLVVGQAPPTARAGRTTPPCTFFYMDGGSIQQIVLSSVELQ